MREDGMELKVEEEEMVEVGGGGEK